MEIVLLRHGKPKVDLSGYLSTKELKQLVAAYNESKIQDLPSEKLKTSYKNYYVICSNLPRSIDSAKKLSLNNIHVSDELYREADIPYFEKINLILPVTFWVILLRIMWLFGFSNNGESFSQAKNRSKYAAENLMQLAQEQKKIIVVGHGLMNRLIGKQLKKKGWQAREKLGKSYWEQHKYTKTPAT